MTIIAQPDPRDPATQHINRAKTYTIFLKKDGLKGKRIGIVTQVAKVNVFKDTPKAVTEHFQMVYRRLQQLGATVVNNITLPKFDTDRQHNTAGEVQDINLYLHSFASTRKSYDDICRSYRTRIFGSVKDCLHYVKTDPKKNGKIYKKVLQRFAKNRAYVEAIMDRYHLDALIIPLNSAGTLTYNDKQVNTWRTAISSNAGLPAITINAGYSKKQPSMPMAMQLIARQYQEGMLITMAYAYESHFKTRLVPHLLMSNNLRDMSNAQFNNFITTIGWRSYQQVLKNEKPQALTAGKFQKIVRQAALLQHLK